MNIKLLLKQAEKFITDNSPAILTTIGVVGTIGTAVLASQATLKAADILRDHPEPTTNVQKVKLVWVLYIPPVVTCGVTVAAIIFANRIGTRRAAAIAAAFSVTEKAFSDYKEKVVETIGEIKEQKVRDAVAQDQVNENPVSNKVVYVANGDVLCMEAFTGRYFTSSHEAIRRAENEIVAKVLNDGHASLGDLYYELGLPRTSNCEEVGWSSDDKPKIDISATVAEDGRPCLVMSYLVEPIRDYYRFH